MKKLSLNLDELRVESFDTRDDEGSRRGTVRAYAETDCCTNTCYYTCGVYLDSGMDRFGVSQKGNCCV